MRSLRPVQVGNFAGIGAADNKPSSFTVKSDLRCITGPASFDVPAKGTVEVR